MPETEVWLYDAGTWQRAPDPIDWEGGDDVYERYAAAGYSSSWDARPFIDLVYPGTSYRVGLTLWVRTEPPECIIDIEGTSEASRSVYVTRFPDALDLMARWTPLVEASESLRPAREKAYEEYIKIEAERHARRRSGSTPGQKGTAAERGRES
jgi:hypothetical protein